METIIIKVYGFMPGSEVKLTPFTAKAFQSIKKELNELLAENKQEIRLCYLPSIIDATILFEAREKINLNQYLLGREDVQVIISRNVESVRGEREILFSPVDGVYLKSTWKPKPLDK